MTSHSNGMSAVQLRHQLGLGSYKTAWLLCARLRRAMADPDRNPLKELVEANELVGALVMGFWNRLTRHQERKSPFRLTRIDGKPTREYLSSIASMRQQEIDGFIMGLFGEEDTLDLPEWASHGLDTFAESRALFAAIRDVVADLTIAAGDKQIATSLKHLRELTLQTEREMHATVLSW